MTVPVADVPERQAVVGLERRPRRFNPQSDDVGVLGHGAIDSTRAWRHESLRRGDGGRKMIDDQVPESRPTTMNLAEIADMIEREAIDASLSALHVEKTAALVGLSETTAAYEVARWQRRAGRMHAAAGVIRGLIAHPGPA
jgi:hypothetical protein